jgi:hypothetical protein
MDWTTALMIWGAIEAASKAISVAKNAASVVSYLSRLFKKIENAISESFDLAGQRKKLICA